MYDELTDESVFTQLPIHKQADLISHHCAAIKDEIRQTTTLDEAQSIMDEQCKYFETVCSSIVIQKAMRKYVQDIILEKWRIIR